MFKKNDAVVHPAHGVGIICEISKETISGREKTYYKIEFPLNEIDTVMVPVDNAENVGLRAVVGEDVIQEILFILTDTEGEYLSFVEDESFHKRHKMLLGEIAFARKISLDNAKEILISGRF